MCELTFSFGLVFFAFVRIGAGCDCPWPCAFKGFSATNVSTLDRKTALSPAPLSSDRSLTQLNGVPEVDGRFNLIYFLLLSPALIGTFCRIN